MYFFIISLLYMFPLSKPLKIIYFIDVLTTIPIDFQSQNRSDDLRYMLKTDTDGRVGVVNLYLGMP